ncbi:hypothetical protein MTO96_012105 [Rhipicephalus appendiculatus]
MSVVQRQRAAGLWIPFALVAVSTVIVEERAATQRARNSVGCDEWGRVLLVGAPADWQRGTGADRTPLKIL